MFEKESELLGWFLVSNSCFVAINPYCTCSYSEGNDVWVIWAIVELVRIVKLE